MSIGEDQPLVSVFLIKYYLHASRFLYCSFRKRKSKAYHSHLTFMRTCTWKAKTDRKYLPSPAGESQGSVASRRRRREGSWRGGCLEPTAVLGRPHVPSTEPVIPERVLALFLLWQLHSYGPSSSCLEKVLMSGFQVWSGLRALGECQTLGGTLWNVEMLHPVLQLGILYVLSL